jgi:hypothetical protein
VLLPTVSCDVFNHKFLEAQESYLGLHSIEWGSMGGCLHGTGMRLQLADGTGFATVFAIFGDFWQSNSSEVFHILGRGTGLHVGTEKKN